MGRNPTIEELRLKYADVMKNEAATIVSEWKEPNDDKECNESEYLKRALKNSNALNAKIAEAFDGIRKP